MVEREKLLKRRVAELEATVRGQRARIADLTGRLEAAEAQVSTLVHQVADLRSELAELRTILLRETLTHHERLSALESFRRWGIGLFTGLVVGGIAALLGAIFRIII